MVFNATFNNILVISWRSVLLMEKTGVHGEETCSKHNTYLLYTQCGEQFCVHMYMYQYELNSHSIHTIYHT
jgi:hypothetical protein